MFAIIFKANTTKKSKDHLQKNITYKNVTNYKN